MPLTLPHLASWKFVCVPAGSGQQLRRLLTLPCQLPQEGPAVDFRDTRVLSTYCLSWSLFQARPLLPLLKFTLAVFLNHEGCMNSCAFTFPVLPTFCSFSCAFPLDPRLPPAPPCKLKSSESHSFSLFTSKKDSHQIPLILPSIGLPAFTEPSSNMFST